MIKKFILCLLVLLRLAGALSVPLAYVSNDQYISGGTATIDTSLSYRNNTLVWDPINYTIPLPPKMLPATRVQVAVMMKSVSVASRPTTR